MKSCLGLLLTLVILIAVFGTLAAFWHLNSTTEFRRAATESTE